MIGGKTLRWGFVLSGIFAIGLGCGRGDLPDLGYVTGTVTMDGKPLEGAIVEFHSDAGGRPGVGVTDAEGKYELKYTGGVEGSKIGPAEVSITTEWPEGEPPEGESETIPQKYNSKTTLKETVEAGNNTFDFNLESK